jgi:phage tail sheath protein FI
MSQYLSAGLFRSERSAGAGAVAGVSPSTYATCGWLRKGPENEAQLVTSFDKFVEIFGTYWRNSFIPFEIAAFFDNAGARAYVTRTVPSDAVKAENASCYDDAATKALFSGRPLAATVDLSVNSFIAVKIDGAVATQVDCVGAVPASTTPAEMAAAIDAVADIAGAVGTGNRMDVETDVAGAAKSIEFVVATVNDATAEILGLDVSGGKTYLYTGEDASDWTITAAWNGAYYNQVRMCVSGNDDYQDGNGGWTKFDVEIQDESEVGEADWSTLESYESVVMDNDTDEYFISDVVNDRTNFCEIAKGATYNTPRALRPTNRLGEWLGEGDGALLAFSGVLRHPVVHFGSLSIVAGGITAVDDGAGNLTGTGIVSGAIDYNTGVWSLTYTVAPSSGDQILSTDYEVPASEDVCCQLSGGTDGTSALTRGDVTDPALKASKVGLYAFDILDEILNISMPDFAGDIPVANDLIVYAEQRKNVFVITTTGLGVEPTAAVQWLRNTANYNTSYAGLYYPWVKIYDPIVDDGRSLNIPPGGFIAGAFARTDTNRNVGKAPGGINDGKILGAVGLERILDKGERDVLYPARINPLIDSPQTGRAVWGVRTLSKDSEWLYTNVRRLFMYCEQSIYNSLFWAVFENNGSALWQKIIAQGNGFFRNIFDDGYLAGESPSEAWFIKCDSDNNPQSAIDAGLLTVDYYIAPNKPAEFIRLRFQQKIGTAA